MHYKILLFPKILISIFSFMLIACSSKVNNEMYKVKKISDPVKIDGDWNKLPWSNIQALTIDHHMGESPEHKPNVQAKIAYDNEAIYVIFNVEDQYVMAVAKGYQGSVYKDSCVEFFFTPGEDVTDGYINLEMNCGGTALFHYQKVPRKNSVSITEKDFEKVQIAHTLPKIVEPEIEDPVKWNIEYRIPFEILENYMDVIKPGPGVIWKANLYKCADDSSHPHWLTWAVIDRSQPDFHRPEYFGALEFQ